MLYCEVCRLRNNWPTHTGWPYIGTNQGTCEVCNKHCFCHDVPASFLKKDKTTEEKLVDKMMQQGYKDKAEQLVICFLSGQLDHKRTQELREAFVRKNGEIDWHGTYFIRLKLVEMHRKIEEIKRDNR